MSPLKRSISIFVPSSLKCVQNGWIVGCWHGTSNVFIHVLAIVHSSDGDAWHKIATNSSAKTGTLSLIGIFENATIKQTRLWRSCEPGRQFSEFVHLKVEHGQIFVSDVRFENESLVLQKQCKVFVYEPATFLSSELLAITMKRDHPLETNKLEEDYNCMEKLLLVLQSWQSCKWPSNLRISDLVKKNSVRSHEPFHTDDCQRNYLNGRYSNFVKMLCKLLFCSSFICQFTQRLYQIKNLSKISRTSIRIHHCLRCRNTLASIVLDMLLGMFILHHFLQWMTVEQMLDLFITSANMVADNLQRLLHWLMGVPAGLKLNYPLNSALGYFFLYHIYLWKTYITVVRPILHTMIQAITLLGWLGFSFQLSLVSDLMSLATFHVYCFYVYAARLYHLHSSGLLSLWRLVRGRKWNPLRQRVDSCTYSTDQLYLGTLIFMILLFLMPTTMLYYVVFCMLRLGSVAVVGVLHHAILLIDTAPIYAILMYLGNSPLVTGELRLETPVQLDIHQPLQFRLRAMPCKLGKVCHLTKPLDFLPNDATPWSTLLNSLIVGKLIYPF